MSTHSRSRSSAISGEGYFDWHDNLERRQQENERKLRHENEVLWIQASSSSPSSNRRSRSLRAHPGLNEEVTYPENMDSPPNEYGARLGARPPVNSQYTNG
ncbi:hypothetical protein PVL29_020518 [Vitis rotundifolia]|uniref:Uncharacterized protein n=1 Tax=Vitis rotundifolia TaxID=103349 RepID=A0AA39DC60_VITRO|nr:hypothetical protein PVL29_020518 [Vitis rotundifolia]